MVSPNTPPPDWDALAQSRDFRALLRDKARFLIPATIFFVVYYFALPVLVGYFPEMMEQQVWGHLNWAYVFALSQFFMAWAVAYLYVRKAAQWDREAAEVIKHHSND